MGVVDEVAVALRRIEPQLLQPTKGGVDSVVLAEEIRAVRKLLTDRAARWVGVTEAKRLLAASSVDRVKDWACRGLLQSRTLPSGRLQLLLDNVLREREVREGLFAIDRDEEISTDEALRLLRPRGSAEGRETVDLRP